MGRVASLQRRQWAEQFYDSLFTNFQNDSASINSRATIYLSSIDRRQNFFRIAAYFLAATIRKSRRVRGGFLRGTILTVVQSSSPLLFRSRLAALYLSLAQPSNRRPVRRFALQLSGTVLRSHLATRHRPTLPDTTDARLGSRVLHGELPRRNHRPIRLWKIDVP